MKHLLLSALLLVGLIGCSKGDEAAPTISANIMQLTLKNQRVVFPASAATLTISRKGTLLDLTAQALDATDASIAIQAGGANMEFPGLYLGDPYTRLKTGSASSKYGYVVTGYYQNPCGNPMSGHVVRFPK